MVSICVYHMVDLYLSTVHRLGTLWWLGQWCHGGGCCRQMSLPEPRQTLGSRATIYSYLINLDQTISNVFLAPPKQKFDKDQFIPQQAFLECLTAMDDEKRFRPRTPPLSSLFHSVGTSWNIAWGAWRFGSSDIRGDSACASPVGFDSSLGNCRSSNSECWQKCCDGCCYELKSIKSRAQLQSFNVTRCSLFVDKDI